MDDRSPGVCGGVVIVEANGDSNWQVNEGLRASALNENSYGSCVTEFNGVSNSQVKSTVIGSTPSLNTFCKSL